MTFETILNLKNNGLLQYEFSILGVPATSEDVESWLNNFQKLRNKLAKNNQVTFESIDFCNNINKNIIHIK